MLFEHRRMKQGSEEGKKQARNSAGKQSGFAYMHVSKK